MPPAPRAMGPVGGTGGTRVWGVWVPGRRALVAGLGRAPVVQRRVRKTNASAGRAFLPGRKATPLKTSVSRCRHVGEPHGVSSTLVLGTSAKMKTSHASRKIALCTSSLGIAGTSSSDHVPTTCRGVRIPRVVPQLEEGDDVLVEEILSRRRFGRYRPSKRMPGDRCRADQTTRTDHPR